MAAHVLGFAGIDNQGLEGIELQYDSYLSGKKGQIVAERDAVGKEIPEGMHSYVEAEPGSTVVLAIDEVIQYIAEREIKKAVEETRSKRGLVLAIDPTTGEILANAVYPSYDPNSFNDVTSEERRNLSIVDAYEPGSTFKIVTSAAALEEGLVTKNETFYDKGYIRIGGATLRCWRVEGHGTQTFSEALGNSCNPVFVELAQRLGAEKFTSYIKAFGFGVKTGVDFPGETSGLVQNLSKLGPVELATTGFGQGISVTPLQMLSAVCAIANNGVLMKPILVKEIIDANGNVIKSNSPTKVRQVVSEKTAKDLTDLMVSVVSEGSGNRAAVLGFPVAGKTGTAQKAENGVYGNGRIASFVGFAPANDPKVAMLIILDEPSTDIKFGGVLSAPVFGAIMSEVVRHLELIPNYPTKIKNEVQNVISVPNVMNKSLVDAKNALSALGFSVRAEGFGTYVTNQVPKAGTLVAKGTSVVLTLLEENHAKNASEKVTVPSVVGKTLKDAVLLLGAKDLCVKLSGSGFVKSQNPKAGSTVSKGALVELYLE